MDRIAAQIDDKHSDFGDLAHMGGWNWFGFTARRYLGDCGKVKMMFIPACPFRLPSPTIEHWNSSICTCVLSTLLPDIWLLSMVRSCSVSGVIENGTFK